MWEQLNIWPSAVNNYYIQSYSWIFLSHVFLMPSVRWMYVYIVCPWAVIFSNVISKERFHPENALTLSDNMQTPAIITLTYSLFSTVILLLFQFPSDEQLVCIAKRQLRIWIIWFLEFCGVYFWYIDSNVVSSSEVEEISNGKTKSTWALIWQSISSWMTLGNLLFFRVSFHIWKMWIVLSKSQNYYEC